MKKNKNLNFMKFKNFEIQGNILDDGWLNNLKYKNGKTNVNSVLVLSEIVYWYRPTPVKDEKTSKLRGYKKKFKADKLQKSYDDLANRFGLSKDQARAAINFLESKKLITTEFRTIVANGKKHNNVLFIEAVYEEIEKITGSNEVVDDEIIFEDEADDDNNDGGNNDNEKQPGKKQVDDKKPKKRGKEPYKQKPKLDNKLLTELKDNFEVVTASKTKITYIKDVTSETSIESFEAVLKKWKKIKPMRIETTIEAVFRDAVRREHKGNGYKERQEDKSNTQNSNSNRKRLEQECNFEQRQYDDEFFEGLYDNF